jgi:ankyrin repeat protein
LEALLAAGFSPLDEKPTRHYGLAKTAAAYGNLEMLKHLEAKGDAILGTDRSDGAHARIDSMTSTLPIAVSEGQREVVAYLLGRTDEIGYTDYEWFDALAGAARNGDIDSLKLLLLYVSDGATRALISAATYGKLETVRFLLDMGADPTNALTVACETNRLDVIEMLLDAGADINKLYRPGDGGPLRYAIENDNFEVVKYLVERGADANAGAGDSPVLHIAINGGQFEILRYLVEHGADVNAVSSLGGSVHRAVRMGGYNILRYLLDRGADVNTKEEGWEGDTPMSLALGFVKHGNVETVTILLEYDGIDFTIENDKGKSPMDLIDELRSTKLIFGKAKERREKLFALIDAYIAAGRAKAV